MRIKAGILARLLYRRANDSRMHALQSPATFLGLARVTLRALEPLFGRCAIEQAQLLGMRIITLGWITNTVHSGFSLVLLSLRQSSVEMAVTVKMKAIDWIQVYKLLHRAFEVTVNAHAVL